MLCVTFKTYANQSFSLSTLADVSAKPDEQWLTVLSNPKQPQELWAFSRSGNLYTLSGGTFKNTDALSLNKTLKNFVHFEQLTLHPNFLITNQSGYLTFYTSHIEKNSQHRNRRTYAEEDNAFDFDVVITEWKLSTPNNLSIQQPTTREITRIASPSQNAVSFLGFDQHQKSWHDNYGLIHIAFVGQNQLQSHPVFSGSIHRLNPLPFGLKQYTIPKSNPFLSDPAFAKSTIATGLGNVQEVFWAKNEEQSLIIKKAVNDAVNFEAVPFGSDGRKKASSAQLISSHADGLLSNAVLYSGGQLKQQRNQLLYLAKKSHWQLMGLALTGSSAPDVLWTLDSNLVGDSYDLNLYHFKQTDQLVILDNNNKTITSLHLGKAKLSEAPVTIESEQGSNKYTYYAAAILIILIALFITARRNKLSAIKKMLHKQFAKFRMTDQGKTISLYNRHEETASDILPVQDIKAAHILLNEERFEVFDARIDHAMTNQQEKEIRRIFATIRREKMTDEKVREVHLNLETDKEAYKGCVYLRKGNQRFTKAKFEAVLEQVLDLSWHLSHTSLPEQTQDRSYQPPVETKKTIKRRPNLNKAPTAAVAPALKTKENTVAETSDKTIALNTASEETTIQQDNDIVEALNKLAQLKQSGLLTEQEFTEAKAKLLKKIV